MGKHTVYFGSLSIRQNHIAIALNKALEKLPIEHPSISHLIL
jgi:hypothetical protein